MGSHRTAFSLRLAAMCSLLVSAGACNESTAPLESVMAQGLTAAVVQNQRSTVDTVVFNDCTGEDIALQGTAHVVFTTTESGNGGLHQAFESNMVLTGTGLLTGSRYQSVSTSNSTVNAPGLPTEQTSIGSTRLLRQGAGGDLFAHFLQHITIDALGNIRVLNSDFRFECI
jgi:hypothetical protein